MNSLILVVALSYFNNLDLLRTTNKNIYKASAFATMLAIVLVGESCSTDDSNQRDFSKFDPKKEIAENIVMTYSDSAKVKFRIYAPRMEIYMDGNVQVEEFTKGIEIEFFNDEKEVISTVFAKYALRRSKEGTMLLKDSVTMTNEANDLIETNSILWNDLEQRMSTAKFVKIIKASSKDTLFGIGMEAKTDFTQFKILQFQGKRKGQDIGIDQ